MEVDSDKEENHAPKLSGRRKKAAKAKQTKPGSFGAAYTASLQTPYTLRSTEQTIMSIMLTGGAVWLLICLCL